MVIKVSESLERSLEIRAKSAGVDDLSEYAERVLWRHLATPAEDVSPRRAVAERPPSPPTKEDEEEIYISPHFSPEEAERRRDLIRRAREFRKTGPKLTMEEIEDAINEGRP